MSISSSVWGVRGGITTVALLATVVAASSAHATTVVSNSYLAYDNIGIGTLSGSNPAQVIDGGTAGVTATLTYQEGGGFSGFTAAGSVQETLGGQPVLPGSVPDYGTATSPINGQYLVGFTFDLAAASSIKYTPGSSGQNFELAQGIPTEANHDAPPFISRIPVDVTVDGIVGSPNTELFADLPAGTYTLLLYGASPLVVPEGRDPFVTGTVGGTISAVPLPGSLAMFGSAFLGLVAFGARRRSGRI